MQSNVVCFQIYTIVLMLLVTENGCIKMKNLSGKLLQEKGKAWHDVTVHTCVVCVHICGIYHLAV